MSILNNQNEAVDIKQIQAQADAHAQLMGNDNPEMVQVQGVGEIPLEQLQGLTAEQLQQLQQLDLQQQQELGQYDQQQLIDQEMYMQLNNLQLNPDQYNELQQLRQMEMLKQIDSNMYQNGELDIVQQKELQEQLELLQQEQNEGEPNMEHLEMLLQYQRMQNAQNEQNQEQVQENMAQNNHQEIIDLQNQIDALKQQQANEAFQNARGNEPAQNDFDASAIDPVKLTQIVANLGYNCNVEDLNTLDPFTLRQLLLLQDMEQDKNNDDQIKLKFAMQQYPDLSAEQIQQIIDQDKGNQPIIDILQQQELQNHLNLMNTQNQSQGQILQQSDLMQANQLNQQSIQEANQLSLAQLKQDHQKKQTVADEEREGSNGRLSLNSTEKQKAFEKQKDQMFEDKLWIFYKNMRERLSQSQLEKITRKQNQFCEQMDKVSAEYIKNKQEKGGKESDEINSKSNDDYFENQCNDSTFQEIFYGPNSSLDPDHFIKFVQSTIHEHKDLTKEFRRFLPDDMEDDEQSAEKKYYQFVQNMNFDNGAELLDEQMNGNQDQLIQRLKGVAQMRLLELLKEYSDMKLNGSPQEALNIYTDKIMEIAESYHQYLSTDTQNKFQFDQNDPIQGMSKIDQHEYQMNVILEMIPHEIVENYKFSNPDGNANEAQIKAKNTTKKDFRKGEKQKGRPRGKNVKANEESFVSSSKIESSDVDDNKLHMVDEGSQFENSDSNGNQSNDEGDQESGELEESEQSQDQNEDNEDTVKESDSQDKAKKQGDETETISENQNPSETKLSKKQIQSIYEQPIFKNCNKYELGVFQNLHQSMRSDTEWNEFNKLFKLYLDGVISIEQFFLLFDQRFGYRLSESIKEELKNLLPTRDHSRRCQSNILKPWNDLENQKFEKIPDSSYYKIDQFFQLPICSAKMDPSNGPLYQEALNEKYLMLSLGSESFGFKVRNHNEDLIFKNEDNMYKLDTQIEMYAKCHQIVENEKTRYDQQILIDPKFGERYVFPKHKFSPMIYYWEEKSQQTLLAIMDAKPFQRECLNILGDGLGRKMHNLFNEKYTEIGAFEDVYRKNFKKSLDHRSFQYKEFIKKFQQKHYHMSSIKVQAQNNQLLSCVSDSIMKGGNYSCSEFYHTFGPFIHQDFTLFDGETKVMDYPIDMRYSDQVIKKHQNKLPHQRLLFKDAEAKSIAIKILLLQIKYSTNHHNSESRQKIQDIIEQILDKFMKVPNLSQLNDQCAEGQIDPLTPAQMDLIMNQDSHLYYKKRQEQISAQEEVIDEKQQPILIQIQNVTRLVTAEELHQQKSDQSKGEESPSSKEEKQSLTIGKEASQQSPMKIYQRFDEINLNCEGNTQKEEQEIAEQSLFLPHIPKDKKDEYNLLYAPSNMFMFITLFYSLYERILKAKFLISQKIKQDMAEMDVTENSSLKSKLQNPQLQETFAKERYEHLLKAVFATTTQQVLSGSTNVASINLSGGYSHNHLLMDHNRYEDFARQLLGQNAFLLFQIDKIVSVAIKQLQQMNTDSIFQKSMKLFEKMKESESKSDSNYLINYASQIIFDQQISLKELQNQQQPETTVVNGCNHNVSQFDQAEGLDNEKVQGKIDEKNKDSQVTLSASAAALQQSNFQGFRMQWSNSSQIMSIHFVNLNPLQIQTSGVKNFKKLMSDNFVSMRTHTVQPLPRNPLLKDGGCSGCLNRFNQLDKESKVSPPIFLKKNLQQMTRKRDIKLVKKGYGLTHRIVPAMGTITFDSQTEDVLNAERNDKMSVEQEFKEELKRSKKARDIRNKRLQDIMEGDKNKASKK